MVSEELLIICSAEELEKIEDVVPVSELDDESEEHAVSTAATAAPEKITPSLVFVNSMF